MRVVDIEPKLSDYYKLLNCDTIDFTSRMINGKMFDIICDDEGLLKPHTISAGSVEHPDNILAGNLLFVQADEEGQTIGLSDEEIQHLKDSTIARIDENMNLYPLLVFDIDNLNRYKPFEFIKNGKDAWGVLNINDHKLWVYVYDEFNVMYIDQGDTENMYFVFDTLPFGKKSIHVDITLEDAMDFCEEYMEEKLQELENVDSMEVN